MLIIYPVNAEEGEAYQQHCLWEWFQWHMQLANDIFFRLQISLNNFKFSRVPIVDPVQGLTLKITRGNVLHLVVKTYFSKDEGQRKNEALIPLACMQQKFIINI